VNFCLVKDVGKPITGIGCVLPFTDRNAESSEQADSFLSTYKKLLQKFTARKTKEIPTSEL